MSCFNCYSSRKLDGEMVDKILERGHRLRSAMVQSILYNDPFNQDVVQSQHKSVRLDDFPRNKIQAFLQGDAMSREDEVQTLEALRSMSAVDLCRATDRTYRSEEPCQCLTCVEYKEKDLNCDLKRVGEGSELTQKIQERYRNEVGGYLRFVDSVKVSVGGVALNEAGETKVLGSAVKDKAAGVGQTFFLEYQIPEVLARNHQKNKAKVDSGRDFGNVVRMCSRRAHQQAISFKQTSIHDVGNFTRIKLEDVTISFRLSFRNFKQKQPISLGAAKFNFSSFEVSKNFTCNQELTLRLTKNAPIVVGALKVSIQLGCGRLYFGKEFIDAISNNKENSLALGSDDVSSTGSDFTDRILEFYTSPPIRQKPLSAQIPQKEPFVPKLSTRRSEPVMSQLEPVIRKLDAISRKLGPVSYKPEPVTRKLEPVTRNPELVTRKPELVTRKPEQTLQEPEPLLKIAPEPVLFGFVYVSEAQFSREVLNSYLTCQMFALDEVANSKLVAFDSNPVYNFSQQIPLVCENDFLLKLRENFMVVEFFEKSQSKDFLIGLTKLPLHQFYLAYRNSVIVKYLSERKLPVIGTDGWESIYNPTDAQIVGQAQILLALGTKEQIDNLETERGFKNAPVKAKTTPLPKTIPISKTVDVGIQSNPTMEPNRNIEDLLNQIVAQKDLAIHVENGTNTEPEVFQPEVRSTSDLLDSLQKALSFENICEKTVFKAHVTINSALHLPSRRKCKPKKSKGRGGKHEDILPSTYVTFEGHNGDLKVTPIVPKSTAPKWDFRCEVALPVEYLTDNQKFLVFKVWRKSTNTTMTPNMQCDHVIGFATVDLTVLSAGLPSVQGWFNINDLAKKCNGQINIHVTPLENVLKYKQECCPTTPPAPQLPDPPLEPGELLGRALKRKFTELDEITQRLRLRLSKVTNDESDASNDEIADEFERDINTLCVEDDFDMVDFEQEAHGFSFDHAEEVGLLQADRHLVDGKQKIDQLLEKLSLISGEVSSRYVSGCSDARYDAEAIMNELDSGSRPNLHSSASFSREMAEKFGSECSEFSDRSEPEGGGVVTEKAGD